MSRQKILLQIIPFLIATYIVVVGSGIYLKEWWKAINSFGDIFFMVGLAVIVVKGKLNKWTMTLFIVPVIINGIGVIRYFWLHNYTESLWNIITIMLCFYLINGYYVKNEQK
ncbi:hypothetical protein BW425_03375 [Bacillus pseudomycoides]|uniref:Uncharacterized protein n=1 Tax=Bacillus pseudomycoides TaxID=64104 RepID=A0A1Y3MRF5_9BACI|nr:hypothetical protein [Bacillus pseudomycoides]OUM50142.1 hypothetical protein BW425_03375 [Bacillus pseudomycoides]